MYLSCFVILYYFLKKHFFCADVIVHGVADGTDTMNIIKIHPNSTCLEGNVIKSKASAAQVVTIDPVSYLG